MKIDNLLTVATLATFSNLLGAADDNSATQVPDSIARGMNVAVTTQAAMADTDKQALVAKFRAMYPKITFTDICASSINGLYELVIGQNVAYSDASGRYFIFGHLFDMKEQVDLTAKRQQMQQTARRVKYPKSLLGNAIKTINGDGSRQLVVFTDPNCNYCKKLEQELAHVNNVTIYTFLYPILGEGSKSLAIAIWCSPDRAKVWRDWMLNQKRPPLVSCVTPLNDITVLGSRLGITGTPTLIATDGRILPGVAQAKKINEWLEGGTK